MLFKKSLIILLALFCNFAFSAFAAFPPDGTFHYIYTQGTLDFDIPQSDLQGGHPPSHGNFVACYIQCANPNPSASENANIHYVTGWYSQAPDASAGSGYFILNQGYDLEFFETQMYEQEMTLHFDVNPARDNPKPIIIINCKAWHQG